MSGDPYNSIDDKERQKTPWAKQRKIAHIGGGVKRDAVVTLAQTLEKAKAGRIQNVYIGICWDDGSFVGDWSNMPVSDLSLHARVCQREADMVFFTGSPSP